MTTDETDRIPADALEESVLVVGGDEIGQSVADRIAADEGVRASDGASAPDAVVLAVDASRSDDAASEFPSVPEAAVSLAVTTVPDRPSPDERAVLDALGARVDAVVLASGGGVDDLTAAVGALVSIVQDTGLVNVDLADVETVFRPVDLAALGVGEGPIDEPTAAAREAVASLPAGIETDAAGGVIVDLVGPPRMSIADVDGAVSAVRDRVGPDAHVIWGGSVDPTVGEGLAVRVVFAGVESARVAPGDDCPRCGASLSAYTLDGRTMLSCEACGFADVSVRLRN
jgi:hypothetical protein